MKASLHTKTLLITTILSLVPFAVTAGPVGGNVSVGSATINASGNNTTINQSSNKAIINWDSFNTDAHESVLFNQPATNSITLNRITGNSGPTNFDGALNANGKVWILNPDGIMFGSNARVNVGGLLATTSSISDKNFNRGDYSFTPGAIPTASILNQGNITVARSGLATLVAPNVANSGTIKAQLGRIQAATGDSFALDTYGDGLVSLSIQSNEVQQLANSGILDASGGSIVMTTSQVSNVLDNVINLGGHINSNTLNVTANSGSIIFDGEYNIGNSRIANSRSPFNATLAATHNIEVLGNARIGNSASKTNVLLHSNKDELNSGYIYMADGASIVSGGGNITLGGGYNPLTGYAYGVYNPYVTTNVPFQNGITLGSATLDAGGGNITLNGHGAQMFGFDNYPAYAAGVMAQSGNHTGRMVTKGNGRIVINGAGTDSGFTPITSYGAVLGGYQLFTEAGDIRVNAIGGNTLSNSTGLLAYDSVMTTRTGNLMLDGRAGNPSVYSNSSNTGIILDNSFVGSEDGVMMINGSGSGMNSTGVKIVHSTIGSYGSNNPGARINIVGSGEGTGVSIASSDFHTVNADVTITGISPASGTPIADLGANTYESTGNGRYIFNPVTLERPFQK